MRKDTESVLEWIRAKRINRELRLDKEETWKTLDNGVHILVNGEGDIVGGPKVPKAKGGENTKKTATGSMLGRKSKTAKTSSGVAFPATRNNVDYSDDIRRVENEYKQDVADKKIPDGIFDKVVSNLTENDILYQKDSVTGKEFASIPMLAALVDRETGVSDRMQAVFDGAFEDGKKITNDLVEITGQCGMHLTMLENAVKGASHIVDKAKRPNKIAKYAKLHGIDQSEVRPEDIAEEFGDLNRYTAITTDANLVSGTKKIIEGLKKKGYEIIEVDNRFLKKGTNEPDLNTDYRAIHIGALTPGGREVEVQVHTNNTLAIKNKNHGIYEEKRNLPEADPRIEELEEQMIRNWDGYKNPEGIETIRTWKRET